MSQNHDKSSKSASKRSRSAAFAWDILRSDIKLYCYPLVRVLAMLALLTVMWPLMFDISPLAVANTADDLLSTAVGEALTKQDVPEAEKQKLAAESQNVFQHMHVGYFLLFLVINVLIGLFSVGALTGQSLAVARGEHRGFGYGYVVALKRSPQLLVWWLVTVLVGFFMSLLESIRYVGPILAMLLGMAWGILTFFSVTIIIATGCGPFGAIRESKNTIKDTWKKISGEDETQASDLRNLRRGFYVGLPFVLINLVIAAAIWCLLFIDFRTLTQGSHHISLGAIGALIILFYVNGAVVSALWAIVKATIYVWAEEGKLIDHVDESEMEHAFVRRGRGFATARI